MAHTSTAPENRERVVSYLPPTVRDRIDQAANRTGITRSSWVCMALTAAVSDDDRLIDA